MTLRGGDRARVHASDMACDDCDLLNAMGMTDRCVLRVCRIGQPCIVQINSTRLGLSREMAGRIMVEPIGKE